MERPEKERKSLRRYAANTHARAFVVEINFVRASQKEKRGEEVYEKTRKIREVESGRPTSQSPMI